MRRAVRLKLVGPRLEEYSFHFGGVCGGRGILFHKVKQRAQAQLFIKQAKLLLGIVHYSHALYDAVPYALTGYALHCGDFAKREVLLQMQLDKLALPRCKQTAVYIKLPVRSSDSMSASVAGREVPAVL